MFEEILRILLNFQHHLLSLIDGPVITASASHLLVEIASDLEAVCLTVSLELGHTLLRPLPLLTANRASCGVTPFENSEHESFDDQVPKN